MKPLPPLVQAAISGAMVLLALAILLQQFAVAAMSAISVLVAIVLGVGLAVGTVTAVGRWKGSP